jgi:hypothetical protein
MPNINYDAARALLEDMFNRVEASVLDSTAPSIERDVSEVCESVFQSNTQAYREVLLGSLIARIMDPSICIRLPYDGQGATAYNARTLDEKVVNPFLQAKRIPSSKGPYLAVFRRGIKFYAETRVGLKDKSGYDSLLIAFGYMENSDREVLQRFLEYLLYKFILLREAANIPISRLRRISLDQYNRLFSGLLATASGGRFPMLLAVAMFDTIKSHFGLDWEISWQAINAADAASGAGGDITIVSGGQVVFAVEITERPVDLSRVVSTFNTKISPHSIEDYLFLLGSAGATDDAKRQAERYFAQGHEVNFVNIKDWMLMTLTTMGIRGRGTFNSQLLLLMEGNDVPRSLKVSWNATIDSLMRV